MKGYGARSTRRRKGSFLRFDDSLHTVLAQDTATPAGAQIAWRQLVDLVGRGRVTTPDAAIERLRSLRTRVPDAVRGASARALAVQEPSGAIVTFFAEDDPAIAAPVLRRARLSDAEWTALLPLLAPGNRAVLRHRRDLSGAVQRALESFGPVDFVLPPGGAEVPAEAAGPVPDAATPISAEEAAPFLPAAPSAPQAPGPFVSFGNIARDLPVVAEARRRADAAQKDGERQEEAAGPFQISDLVARIDAYRRDREERGPASAAPFPAPQQQPASAARSFRFETDTAGTIRWVDGVSRAPLVGLSIDLAAAPAQGRVDAGVNAAFRNRQPFTDARLTVTGASPEAGDWRLSAVPVFDRETGRFTGYRGAGRRPRREESAAPVGTPPGADALRQLVHELRTPTNAISGFAEMIEAEMLGPVPAAYREQAGAIRRHAADLLAAIEDVDLAARLQSRRLELREGEIALFPLLGRVAEDLAPLADMRGTRIALPEASPIRLAVDERAGERLLARLMATLVAACARGEVLRVSALQEGAVATLALSRPLSLVGSNADDLLADDEANDNGPLLGTGFALRLVRNLAVELGGALDFGADRLTLRLPAAVIESVDRASAY